MHKERFKLLIRSNRKFSLYVSLKLITHSLNKFYNSTGKKRGCPMYNCNCFTNLPHGDLSNTFVQKNPFFRENNKFLPNFLSQF